MHAEINVRFTISIDDDKTIPLAILAEFLTEQNVESVLLEELVESLDASCVEALCGEKHARGNGSTLPTSRYRYSNSRHNRR